MNLATTLLLCAFLLDGILEGWRWTRSEPGAPVDYYHPTVAARNGAFVIAAWIGGVSFLNMLGVFALGNFVFREMAMNYTTRRQLIVRKRPWGFFVWRVPRNPWLEALFGAVIGGWLCLL